MVSPDDVPKWAQLVATPRIEDGFEPSEKVDTQTEDSVPGVGHVDYESWELRTQTNRLDIEYEDVSSLPSQNCRADRWPALSQTLRRCRSNTPNSCYTTETS
jgi:hypothetical protein